MKSKTNRCNSCHAPNNTETSRIKHGNCYSCRKKAHQPIIPNEVPRWRLILILGTAVLTFIAISARSIYYQHIAFPYLRNRSRVVWYEFTEMKVVVPILVLVLLSAGLLASLRQASQLESIQKNNNIQPLHWLVFIFNLYFFRA